MMKDIEDGLIDVLLVYRLDRLTRSVRDLQDILDFLENTIANFAQRQKFMIPRLLWVECSLHS